MLHENTLQCLKLIPLDQGESILVKLPSIKWLMVLLKISLSVLKRDVDLDKLCWASLCPPHCSWLEKTLQKNIPCSKLWCYRVLAHLIHGAIQFDFKLHINLQLNVIQISYCFIILFLYTSSQSVFKKTVSFHSSIMNMHYTQGYILGSGMDDVSFFWNLFGWGSCGFLSL